MLLGEKAVTPQEQFLIELAQWMARVAQYSANHPACAPLADRTHTALRRALDVADGVISCTILKDNVVVGDVPVSHPAIRTRIAPHLHERGVLTIQFTQGTSLEELAALVDLLTLPVQTTFDRGGLVKLAQERDIARILIEELTHDITDEQREAQRLRAKLRAFFELELKKRLARRLDAGAGKSLLELLDHPDIAVTILEEDPLAIAEAVAGLCLMVREEQAKTGDTSLFPKLKVILLQLSPTSHERTILGLPALVGEFRGALVWALDGLEEDEVARVLFPAIRRHADDIENVFYAIVVGLPHEGRRYATLRRTALYLYDLPNDDMAATLVLRVLAKTPADFDSYRQERYCVEEHAVRALAMRTPLVAEASERGKLATFDSRRSMSDLVRLASRTRRFAQLCEKLPAICETFGETQHLDAVAGIVRGLRDVAGPAAQPLAQKALQDVVSPELTARLLEELDASSAAAEGAEVDELMGTVKLLVALAPQAVLDRLASSDSRKMRRIMLDALSTAGPSLLPLVRGMLSSSMWYVVRNAVLLVPRAGGTPKDVQGVAHHPNEKVRLEVVRSLRMMQADSVAMDIVAAYLADASTEVRKYASPMLRGELVGPFAVNALEQVASDHGQPEELRRRVVDALGRSALDAAAAALFRLMHPKGLIELGTTRDHAAVALRRSPAPAAAGYFQEGLKSSSFRVRKACERAAAGG